MAFAAVAVVVVIAVVAVTAGGGGLTRLSTEELASQVQASIEQTYASDPATADVQLTDNLMLVHQNGNQYQGVIHAAQNGTSAALTVDVTYDGKTFLWQTH